MTASFRVDRDPWVPVHTVDGHATCVGLRDLFVNAHLYRSIGGAGWTPLALSALYRVLTAITYRVTGLAPTDLSADDWDREWRKIAQTGHFDSLLVKDYFYQYADRWDLFDADRPWLQDPRLPAETGAQPSDLNQIVSSDPSDDGALLRGGYHAAHKRVLPAAQALPHLLTTQYFHAGSPCSVRTVEYDGVTVSSKYAGRAHARGGVSLHPVGVNVFATLMAHLVYPQHTELPVSGDDDLAPWEQPELHNPAVPFPALHGVIGVLTGRGKRSYLFAHDDSDAIVGVWRAPKHAARQSPDADEPVRDPFMTYRPGKSAQTGDGDSGSPSSSWLSLRGDLTRRPWRDLDSILAAAGSSQDRDYESPLALRDGISRWSALGPVTAALVAADQDTAQDKEKGSYLALLPVGDLPADWVSAARLIDSVHLFKESHARLVDALRRAHDKARNQSGGHLIADGADGFWNAATVQFETSIAQYSRDPEGARADARRIALEQFDLATARHLRNPQSQFVVTRERHFLLVNLGKQDS